MHAVALFLNVEPAEAIGERDAAVFSLPCPFGNHVTNYDVAILSTKTLPE